MIPPNSPASTVSASVLDPDRHKVFEQALSNVLCTELAEFTMAQLVDGLPTIDVHLESNAVRNMHGHPIRDHRALCDGALERTRILRDEFDPASLQFKTSLVQAFQNAAMESREFDLRLIEMIATAVHAIAVFLFNLPEKSHQGDIQSVVSFREPDELIEWMPGKWTKHLSLPPLPSIFTHTEYTFHVNYPNGLADVAAYWAEDRIFGGVLLFDRGETGTECKDVYLHSDRRGWTVRVWRPLESQLEQILVFLKHGPAAEESPFPLFADKKVRHRYDTYDAMALRHVYRDPWERVLPPVKDEHSIRRNTFDYPELQEEIFDEVLKEPFYTIGRDNAFWDGQDADGQQEVMGENGRGDSAEQGVRETSADQSSIFDDKNVNNVTDPVQDVEKVEADVLQVSDSVAGQDEVNGSTPEDSEMTEPEIDESRVAEPQATEIEMVKGQNTVTGATDSQHGNIEDPEPVVTGHESMESVAKKGEFDDEQKMDPEVPKKVTGDAYVTTSQPQEPRNTESPVDIPTGGDEACSKSKTGTP